MSQTLEYSRAWQQLTQCLARQQLETLLTIAMPSNNANTGARRADTFTPPQSPPQGFASVHNSSPNQDLQAFLNNLTPEALRAYLAMTQGHTYGKTKTSGSARLLQGDIDDGVPQGAIMRRRHTYGEGEFTEQSNVQQGAMTTQAAQTFFADRPVQQGPGITAATQTDEEIWEELR